MALIHPSTFRKSPRLHNVMQLYNITNLPPCFIICFTVWSGRLSLSLTQDQDLPSIMKQLIFVSPLNTPVPIFYSSIFVNCSKAKPRLYISLWQTRLWNLLTSLQSNISQSISQCVLTEPYFPIHFQHLCYLNYRFQPSNNDQVDYKLFLWSGKNRLVTSL